MYWLSFICSLIQPMGNETNVSLEKEILIACIMSGFQIDLGQLIFPDVRVRVNQKKTLLPFPCPIDALFEDAWAPPIPKYDLTLEATQYVDITRHNNAAENVPEGQLEQPVILPPASSTSTTPFTSSAPATSPSTHRPATTPRPVTTTPPISLPAISKLGLLA